MIWVVLIGLVLLGAEMGFENPLFLLGAAAAVYLLVKQRPGGGRRLVHRRPAGGRRWGLRRRRAD